MRTAVPGRARLARAVQGLRSRSRGRGALAIDGEVIVAGGLDGAGRGNERKRNADL